MAKTNKGRKLFATTATAALVASAIVPVASAAQVNDFNTISSYAQEAVQDLVDRGVITGDEKGNFNPKKSVTRAEAATILTGALGLTTDGEVNFTDVKASAWYYDAINAAVNNGVFSGKGAGIFEPTGNLTRGEAAVILVNAFGLEGSTSLAQFSDEKTVKAWAKEALEIAVANGVIKGDNGKVNANAAITKQDFAVMFSRAEAASDLVSASTVKAINATTVEVTFDGPIADIKALDFKIEGLEVKNAVVKQTASNTAVLTTADQTAGTEYTVTVDGASVGKFTGVAAVVPTKVEVTTTSVQGVIGEEVTLTAKVTVPEGQSVENVPVTFNIVNNSANNNKVEAEVLTKADGTATYSYTRYYGSEDTFTAYATKKSSVYSTGKVYWANAKQLTVKDITEATTLVNGSKKTYQIESAKNAGKYVFVQFEENIGKTPDKLTTGVEIEGVTTYTIQSNDTVGAVSTTKYPFETTTGGKAVTAVKLDSNGKANLVLTGVNASVTPIVFEGVAGIDSGDAGSVIGDHVSEFKSVVYDATALQAKASKVTFELKHTLGLTIEASGVERAALRLPAGNGGRDYVITYTDKDGKVAAAKTKVLVAIPKAGIKGAFQLLDPNNKDAVIPMVTSDTDNYYYYVEVAKEGKATFTVTSNQENDYVAPVAFINNGTSSAIALDKSDLQAQAPITYFVNEVNYAAKLSVVDAAGKAKTSFVSGTDTAFFRYSLVDQNGKVRTADNATTVSFDVYAGTSPLTVNGTTVVPADNYRTVNASIAAGASYAEIKVTSTAPTSATVTATGSKAGIVLSTTEPTSVTAQFTQFATANVTGTTVATTLDTTKNTIALRDTNGNVYVYSYAGAALQQNNSVISEEQFETLLALGASVTVSKDDAGNLTFNIISTSVASVPLTVQQKINYDIQKAVIDGDTSVTVSANDPGADLVVNTDAAIDIIVAVGNVNNLTVKGLETTKVDIVNAGAGTILGDLTIDLPKAHVTLGAGVSVAGNTNVINVAPGTLVNNGILGTVTISDSDGSKFQNNGTVGTVTVSGTGNVTIGGTITTINVTGAANVTTGSGVGTVNLLNENAKATNAPGSSATIIPVASTVKPVTGLEFTDANKGVNIEGQVTFTVTAAIASGSDAVNFDIKQNGTTVATVNKSAVANDKIVASLSTVALKAGDKITVVAKNAAGKESVASEAITVVNDQASVEASLNLVAAQAAVEALTGKSALNLASTTLIADAQTAVDKVTDANQKSALQAKITAAEKVVSDAVLAGTLLVLENAVTPNNYLSQLVLDGTAQVATTGASIETALKTTRLAELVELDATDVTVSNERPDIVAVQAITADNIVADFSQVKLSADGKVIALEGSIFNAAAFKVAKGGKNYTTPYNVTVLGATKDDKLARIQFQLVDGTVTAKVVKYVPNQQ